MNDDKSDCSPPRQQQPSTQHRKSAEADLTLNYADLARLVAMARIAVTFFDTLEAQRAGGHITADEVVETMKAVAQVHDELRDAVNLARSLLNKH